MVRLKNLLRLFGLVVPFVFICCHQVSSYAYDGPTVTSARKYFTGCRGANRFDNEDEDVYAKGSKFSKDTDVDIYVTENRSWQFGDIIGFYIVNGSVTATTNFRGKLKCAKIWESPLTPGKYDIVVDANQDGTYNQGDAVDGRSSKQGFKVVD
ncbi:MAG TPA: hypothetical protein ACFYD6_05485 [Candidatus Brocadiia bacterium]|nr:hypothetical protein [Planctomycetota bacterium]MDO8091940.1 hypothetical protein [Candidatus Brocadiales bacterium]